MSSKTLLTLTTVLMLGVAPAAIAQQPGQTQQSGQQNQTQAQQNQQNQQNQQARLRQMTVSDLLDRQVVDQQGQQVGTVSGIVQREGGQRFVEIERQDSGRVDLLPIERVTVRNNQVVAQVQDGQITGAQESTEQSQAQFDPVEENEQVQVRQQDRQFSQQQDQMQQDRQGQQFGQQQDWRQQDQQRQQFSRQQDWQQQDWRQQGQQFGQQDWQQDQQRFGGQGWQQDQQFGQQQLENALRQAGFTQIQRVGQNVLQARGPDGTSVFVHMHNDTMSTGGIGQQQWRQGQQDYRQSGPQWQDQQDFGRQQQWRQDDQRWEDRQRWQSRQ